MSMIGFFLQLSVDELTALIADPLSVESFIDSDKQKRNAVIDVDKAWHGIHYLLAGDAWSGEPPLADAVLGGTEIGDDFGYGPVRYLTAGEVKAVADALQDITPDDLRSRYVASELSGNDIYPEIWDDPDDDGVGYLAAEYARLRDYYTDAAAKQNAMLIFLA